VSAKTWLVLIVALIVLIAVVGWVAAALQWVVSPFRGGQAEAAADLVPVSTPSP
jgi:hypothetical protein